MTPDQATEPNVPEQPKMDERGLVELDDSVPKQAKIDGDSAVIEAAEMTTRKINAELRWLIYEQGIKNVTVKDPSARHSLGTAILARCKIRFEGSLGYFGVGLIDGPEVDDHRPRRLVGGREHDERRRSWSRTTRARWPARRCAAATWSSRATSARAPGSTRRAARSSRSATPPR